MNLYQKQWRMSNPRARKMQITASRIANVRLPYSAYKVYKNLRKQQESIWGSDYGSANDPAIHGLPEDQVLLSEQVPNLPSTTNLEAIHERSTFQTRQEILQQSMGMSPLDVMSAPARPGVASAQDTLNGHGQDGYVDDSGRYHGTFHDGNPNNPGGSGAIERLPPNGRSTSLDRLAPSLAQTIGSGMLSQDQLQRASYANVASLIRPYGVGYSPEDKQTATFLLQRMILEGFVRGVDVERQLRNSGGLQYEVGGGGCGYSCGGWNGSGPFVQMNRGGYGSDVALLNIFYQEVGHALGQLNHTRGLMAGSYQYSDLSGQTVANYSKWLDWYFQDVGKVRFTPTRGMDSTQVQQWLAQNPNAFPSLSGVNVPPGGPPGSPPGTTPPGVAPPNVTTNVYNITPTAVNPGSSSVGSLMGGGGDIQPISTTDATNTPVAGSLPDMASLQAFAAGLQENAIRGSGIANLNPLLRLKSG